MEHKRWIWSFPPDWARMHLERLPKGRVLSLADVKLGDQFDGTYRGALGCQLRSELVECFKDFGNSLVLW